MGTAAPVELMQPHSAKLERLSPAERFYPFLRLGGPLIVAVILAAIAPAVRGQVNLMGVYSARVNTTYYVGLFYDFSGSAPQIISTDVNGVRTVLLADGYLSQAA